MNNTNIIILVSICFILCVAIIIVNDIITMIHKRHKVYIINV
jgi:hypothetical protein